MNALKQIVCIWLFYVLHGIILIGLVKVEVQTTVRQKDQQKQNKIERAIAHTGLWTGTISERLYIRNNVIQIELSKQLLPHPAELVNTVSVTRGLCIIFEEKPVWCQMVLILQSLLSILVFIYFLTRVGGKIQWLLENLISSLPISPKACNNKTLNSIVMSLLFLVLGLTLCIPLRNLYLTGLADQEDKIVEEISSQVIENDNYVYLSIHVDWLLVFYFSFLNIGFLLSFSYFSATVIDLVLEELRQQFAIDNQKETMTVPPSKYFNV